MQKASIRLQHSGATANFRAAVSLHSHTLHSKESLDFLDRLAGDRRWLDACIGRAKRSYLRRNGRPLDFRRGWWTPPLSPHAAWALEKNQIESRLGLSALVSLTDHDDVEAPLSLHVLEECAGVPISVEWTVPYEGTFFHLGIHNLPAERARECMSLLGAFTRKPDPVVLISLLAYLSATPDLLVVFNHPCWDESRVGPGRHRELVEQFIGRHGDYIHAIEFNGLRPVSENRLAVRLAEESCKPLISGGDRHGLEPNEVLNLTNASTFSEFVSEVRAGFSLVLIMGHFFEPFALRVFRTVEDALGTHRHHGLGWHAWSDRVFYEGEDGVTRSLTQLLAERHPRAIALFARTVDWIRRNNVRGAFLYLSGRRQEAAF